MASIDVTVTTAPITVTVDDGTTVTVGAGTVGPAGPKGDAGTNGTNGQGVPTGGTTGQVLAKKTGTNYDTEWVDQSGGGGGGSGTVTSVTGTAPISVASGTTTPVVSIAAATTSAAGSMSAADKTKLDGVEAAATANATNAQLRDRSTHTGTQTLSTISDAGTAAAKNAPATGNASATEVVLGSDTRLTDSRTPTAHKASHSTGGTDALAPSDIGAVPTSRTVNGSALTGDITVTAAPSGSAGGDLTGTYPNPTIGTGKVTVAKLSATGTADSTTFLRGDGSWAAPTATVADGSISTAKLADSAVTSAKIADGTIVDADISASAAIASTKISGLKTVATDTIFDAVGDLPVGTGADASARLAKGTQGQVLAVGSSTLGYISAPPSIGGFAQPTASDHSTFGITSTIPIWATLGNQGAPTSGRIVLVPIELDVNLTISAIAFTSGTTAGATLTNQWFVLCNSSKVALAYTTNDTSTAWGTNTRKQLSLTSSYTTTYRGRHYLGVLVTATTVPSLRGLASTGTGIQSYALNADTGLTTPGTAGTTAYTGTASSASIYYGEVV